MKKQELIKIIELVVRKEVKKQMNEIFIKDNDSSSLAELVTAPTPKKVQKPKKEAINHCFGRFCCPSLTINQ